MKLPLGLSGAWLKPVLFGMLGLALLGTGWVVRGWRDGAATNELAQTQLKAAAAQALALNQTNQATALRMASLLATLEGQAHAFAAIDAYLAAHPMGACTFSTATDRLWGDAYQAAFGPAHAPGGGHAAARPAAAAPQRHESTHR